MLLKSYIIYRYLESPKPQKPWKNKNTKPEVLGCLGNQNKKQKTKLWGECLVLTQKIVFLFSLGVFVFFGFKSQKTKKTKNEFCCFLHTYYQPISQKKTHCFLFFNILGLVFCIENKKLEVLFISWLIISIYWSYPFKHTYIYQNGKK